MVAATQKSSVVRRPRLSRGKPHEMRACNVIFVPHENQEMPWVSCARITRDNVMLQTFVARQCLSKEHQAHVQESVLKFLARVRTCP